MNAIPQKSAQQHAKSVAELSATVRKYHDRGERFRIRHGSTNSTRQTATKGKHFVDTGSLSAILAVDTTRQTCVVEANVPMDQLVKHTLAHHGLVPLVVMEFPGITVGGGFSGTSAESSSFSYGFFDRIIVSIEMVLANGDVVHCSEDENPDLFHGAAGAMGTLGVVTLLEVQLKPARTYVQTTYHPVTSVADAAIRHFSEDEPKRTFSKPNDPWFYLHVRDTIRNHPSDISTEAIPLAEYLFRYDRGAFWAARWAFDYFKTPFNSLTRRLFDGLMHTRILYKAQDATPLSASQYIAQDIGFPFPRAEEFINYANQAFGIWPLWLCPLKPTPHPTINPFPASGHNATELLLNVGLWGPAPTKRRDKFVELNRDLEEKLTALGGGKALYAHTFYTEDEFWRIYDREWYDALRGKYGATSLPSVYDKVKGSIDANKSMRNRVLQLRPLGGAYGVLKAIRYRYGSEYRQIRREAPL
ncbi:MAG: hypothetical protein Q9177_000812 [Variospora cf. flavescens]